jgi:hypothetical protein
MSPGKSLDSKMTKKNLIRMSILDGLNNCSLPFFFFFFFNKLMMDDCLHFKRRTILNI